MASEVDDVDAVGSSFPMSPAGGLCGSVGAAAVSLAPDAGSTGVEASAATGVWSTGASAEGVDGVCSEDGSEEPVDEVSEEVEGLAVAEPSLSKGALLLPPVAVLGLEPVFVSSAMCLPPKG